jgi:alpha-tubulin suppressor-like RCC1 family protein
MANTDAPVAVSGSTGYKAVSAGSTSACAITSTNGLTCWGAGFNGDLGNGSVGTGSAVPTVMPGVTGVSQLAMGGAFGCARMTGTIKCWGSGGAGQLGNGANTGVVSTPVAVTGITTATQVAAGLDHACAIVGTGHTVSCWGNNANGELGNGTTTSSNVPVAVTGIANAIAVTAGQNSSCAVLTGGTVDCWGADNYGQIGNGKTGATNYPTPQAVTGLTGVTALSGEGFTMCGLVAAGAVDCWGYGGDGQDGNGSQGQTSTPGAVTGLTGAKAISAGYDMMCAITSTNTEQCWGFNQKGELGNGVFGTSSNPAGVSGITAA